MAQRQISATLKWDYFQYGAKVIRRGKREFICVSSKANSEARKRYIEFCSRFDKNESKTFDPIIYSLMPTPGDDLIPSNADIFEVQNRQST